MSLHVLIVEDEPLIGAAMQMLVEDIGGTVSGPHVTLADGMAAAGNGEAHPCGGRGGCLGRGFALAGFGLDRTPGGVE